MINSEDDKNKKIASFNWNYMQDKADKENILIFKYETIYVLWIIGANHGYAGIVYSSRTVEE